jgi:hypothetical protein
MSKPGPRPCAARADRTANRRNHCFCHQSHECKRTLLLIPAVVSARRDPMSTTRPAFFAKLSTIALLIVSSFLTPAFDCERPMSEHMRAWGHTDETIAKKKKKKKNEETQTPECWFVVSVRTKTKLCRGSEQSPTWRTTRGELVQLNAGLDQGTKTKQRLIRSELSAQIKRQIQSIGHAPAIQSDTHRYSSPLATPTIRDAFLLTNVSTHQSLNRRQRLNPKVNTGAKNKR